MFKSLYGILTEAKHQAENEIGALQGFEAEAEVTGGPHEATMTVTVNKPDATGLEYEVELVHDRAGHHVNVKCQDMEAECFDEDASSIHSTALGLLYQYVLVRDI
jgi:hypothetical protein